MPNFDFMNKLRKNVLSGNDYQFVPLQRVEGANSAGLMPDGTLANAPQPEIKGLQIDENGKMYETDIEPEVRSSFVKNLVNNIGNKILGTPVGAASNIEQIGANEFNASLSKTPRQGGFLNDIANGYRENYYQPFNINNLGQNKGWGTRLGEGFGTLGRFVDSSLGRGILAAGLSAATGYGEPLEELAIATVGRQRAKTADRLYRDQLKAQGINTDDIKGNITPEIYRNILYGQQLQDNAAYRNMMLNNQQRQIEATERYRQDMLKRQEEKDAQDNYYKSANLGLQREKLSMQKEQQQNKTNENKQVLQKIGDIQAVEQQLNDFVKSFDKVNNPYRYRVAGGVSNKLNTLTKEEANFNSQRTLLFNKIARDLGGEKGVLSDQDIKRIEMALPTLADTTEQKKAKMEGIYNLLNIQKARYQGYTGNSTPTVDNDPLGIL